MLSFFRRSRPSGPDDVLSLLIEAATKEKWDRLTALCSEHQSLIREHFKDWAAVPPDIRSGPEPARRRFVETVIAVARIFDANGDSSLLRLLMRDQDESPIVRWQRDLEEGQSLLDQGKNVEASVFLERAVAKYSALQGGTAVDAYMPVTLGKLGDAYHRLGNIARATECMARAKALCEAAGDAEGAAVYEGNLRVLRADART